MVSMIRAVGILTCQSACPVDGDHCLSGAGAAGEPERAAEVGVDILALFGV